MSQSPSGSSVDDEPFFLEYRCHPVQPEPPSPTSPRRKHSSTAAPDATSLSAMGSPTSAEPRRIVLSTDSPAALKVGTQQLIPKSLAISTKTKNNPSRHQSVGAARSSQEPPGTDPKRASVPSFSLEEEVEEDGGGILKRNLRNMSYRAAMKSLSAEPEPANAVPLLKPVVDSGILQKISPEERKRQEAMFEIITSEYSYMHSLGVLVGHFMRSEELKGTMTQMEHHHLFSNISDILMLVKSCNEGARSMERTEQMYTLQKQLEFGKKKITSRTAVECNVRRMERLRIETDV
ncbi:rho guanine nucleotide exchange factor 16 [Limosa lapponica baueri]|uniref:Rho guanine nucleotide exchange factor 16 n=1 Tax=Limosa lapponica baueri TaxID=1758121 RepID=A0A2I0TC41_LIMLA|nr:rho guanine nucleotide exchange factor 16 [Limosa lapponica baueri]